MKDLSAWNVLPLFPNEYLFKPLIHTLDIEAETSSRYVGTSSWDMETQSLVLT